MKNLIAIRLHIISMLIEGLSKALTYHNINHTLDVTVQCLAIAKAEGITDKQILLELQVAALYHDTGFLYVYNGHEERGCEIAREELPGFGFNEKSVKNICELIMATKVPQAPRNKLQQIICDADLDYLGRTDFFETSNNLQRELTAYNLISNPQDWEQKQIDFLQTHQYFTKTSRAKRTPAKTKLIMRLLKLKNAETK